jgi:hypothetical protein
MRKGNRLFDLKTKTKNMNPFFILSHQTYVHILKKNKAGIRAVTSGLKQGRQWKTVT